MRRSTWTFWSDAGKRGFEEGFSRSRFRRELIKYVVGAWSGGEDRSWFKRMFKICGIESEKEEM